MSDVFVKIRNRLSFTLMKDDGQVLRSSKLVEDLGVDTVDLFEFAAAWEGEFDIEISNSTLDAFFTVGDVVRFVEARISDSAKGTFSPLARGTSRDKARSGPLSAPTTQPR